MHTVVDATNVREVAEFYRQLLNLRYRPGDEPPADGPDTADWLVLTENNGTPVLAFQLTDALPRTTWPDTAVPMQLHLDFTVPDREALTEAHERAMSLGAALLLDRTDDQDEPLYVFSDPAGHPFCIFLG